MAVCYEDPLRLSTILLNRKRPVCSFKGETQNHDANYLYLAFAATSPYILRRQHVFIPRVNFHRTPNESAALATGSALRSTSCMVSAMARGTRSTLVTCLATDYWVLQSSHYNVMDLVTTKEATKGVKCRWRRRASLSTFQVLLRMPMRQ